MADTIGPCSMEIDELPDSAENDALLNNIVETQSRESSEKESGNLVDGSSVAAVLALFSVYSLRMIFAPWLWTGPGLNIFIPILSPVYRQAEHWQSSAKYIAVICHVLAGSTLLLLGILQFDKKLRNQYPTLHRWTGRVYTICGVLTILSLRLLRPSVGAGSSPHGHNESLAYFVDTTSALWVIVTTIALGGAITKHIPLHRDSMALSLALAAIPIPQRLLSWCLVTPLAMATRLLLCAWTYHIPPWTAQWGPPGTPYTLLVGQSDACASTSLMSDGMSDTRACPYVLSLDGYGEAEIASFALSAWCGLLFVLAWGVPRLWSYISPPTQPHAIETARLDALLLTSMDQGHIWYDLVTYVNRIAMIIQGKAMSCWKDRQYPDKEIVMAPWIAVAVRAAAIAGVSVTLVLTGGLAFVVIIVSAHLLLWILLYAISVPLYYVVVAVM